MIACMATGCRNEDIGGVRTRERGHMYVCGAHRKVLADAGQIVGIDGQPVNGVHIEARAGPDDDGGADAEPEASIAAPTNGAATPDPPLRRAALSRPRPHRVAGATVRAMHRGLRGGACAPTSDRGRPRARGRVRAARRVGRRRRGSAARRDLHVDPHAARVPSGRGVPRVAWVVGYAADAGLAWAPRSMPVPMLLFDRDLGAPRRGRRLVPRLCTTWGQPGACAAADRAVASTTAAWSSR